MSETRRLPRHVGIIMDGNGRCAQSHGRPRLDGHRAGADSVRDIRNIKPARSLNERLRVAMDNGAKRALIQIENKRNFVDVAADVMEQVDPSFYGDPKTAAQKVLGA